MAFCFMKYGTISGSVTAEGFKSWIELDEYSFSSIRTIVPSSAGAGTNREAAVPSMSDIVIKKKLDSSSIFLLQQSLWGEGVKVQIKLCHSDKSKIQPYLEIELDNSMVSSFSTTHDGGRPVETITINFTKITCIQHELNEKNESKAKYPMTWDIARAKES